MANFEPDPQRFQSLPGIQETGELPHGILLVPVSVRKMGKQPLRLQAGQGAQRRNGGGGLPLTPLPPEKAQPGHAGVHLHVDLQRPSRSLCRAGQGPAGLQVGDSLGHIMLQQQLGQLGRRLPQAQDGDGHAAAAQLRRLIHTGHRQHIGPQRLQLPPHLEGPVAVGVSLAQPQKAAVRSQHGPQSLVVMGQTVQGYLRPGPHLRGLCHGKTSIPW